MSKFPALTSDEIIKILLENGFQFDHQTGSHRVYYNSENKKRVVVPYHKKTFQKEHYYQYVNHPPLTALAV